MTCLVMPPYRLYDVFFINWKQCVSVIWILISIETETKEIHALHENRTDGMVELTAVSTDIGSFMNFVMPICPPPNNLHLLCDVTLAEEYVTCKERANVIRFCLDLFEGIYVNSDWEICELVTNYCEDTVKVLQVKGYIVLDPTDLTTERSNFNNTSHITDITTAPSVRTSHISTHTDAVESTSYHTSIYSNDTVVITTDLLPGNMPTSNMTSGTSGVVTTSMSPTEEQEPLTTSYVYPILGVIVVLIEIAILFFIYFYLKKKQRSPPYRHPSKESLHEEMIAPETTSPTQALVINNAVYEEDDIFKQDQKIYQSYLNLKYIDESSVEATPEKVIVK